jgi:hypothetical protein
MAFTTSNTSLEQLSEVMKYAAPVASGLGVSIEETAAMAGLLGNVGIQASMAGTTLRNTFLNLSTPTTAAAKHLKRLGVQTKDLKGNLRSMPEILVEIAEAMDKQNLGTGVRAGIISDVFGTRATPGMIEMLSQAKRGELRDYINVVKNSEGAAARVRAIMDDNTLGDLTTLKSTLENLAISLFETIKDDLRALIQNVTAPVRRFTAWVDVNKETVAGVMKLVAAFLAFKIGLLAVSYAASLIAAPFLHLIKIYEMLKATWLLAQAGHYTAQLAALGAKVKELGKAVVMLGRFLLMTPLGAALAALAAAAYLVYRRWEDIKGGALALWEDITAVFSAGMAWIKARLQTMWNSDYFTPFRFAILGLLAAGYLLVKLLGVIWAGWKKLLGWLWEFVKLLGSLLAAMVGGIFRAAWFLVGKIVDLFKWMGAGIWGAIQWVGFKLGDLWEWLKSTLLFQWILETWEKVWDEVIEGFGELIEKFKNFGAQIMQGFSEGIWSGHEGLRDSMSMAVGDMVDWVTGRDALDINSPSRVFMGIGGETMAGLARGIERARALPIGAASMVAGSLAAVIPDAGAMPASRMISRALPAAPGNEGVSPSAATLYITVNPAPGMDERALADLVARKIQEAQWSEQARARSRLSDAD